MAEEVGQRLLPAFNTTTGLPYPKVSCLRAHVMHFDISLDAVFLNIHNRAYCLIIVLYSTHTVAVLIMV